MQEPVSQSAVLEQLDRILTHSLFARADRLRRFLRHTVHRTMDGATDTLKESLLGQEVFDRGSRFDPKADPIVRIDARRLRHRLAQYYEGPGTADPIRISLDPGSYVPRFSGPPPTREITIAVLPFRTLASAPGSESFAQEFAFAQELNEAVCDTLAQTSGVRMIARHSAIQWHESDQPHPSFRADIVLRGAVRTEADQLHVSLHSVDAAGRLTWSRGFRGAATEWFAVQEDVRQAVARAMGATEGQWKRPRLAIANRTAHQAFLRGKHELAKASPATLSDAESHFRQAIQEDATLPGAWAGLAEIYSTRGLFLNQSRAAMIKESRSCARRALAHDPGEPDALVVIGRIQALEEFDIQGALATFTQILDTHGEHARARLFRALYCLAARGDLEAAEGEVESVLEIDPLRLEAQFTLGQVLYFQRRYDAAIQIFATLIELAPTFAHAYFAMAMASLASGRIADLSSAHTQQLQHIPYPLVGEWGEALRLHFSGASREALAVLDRMEAEGMAAPTVVADACVRLGRLDRAVDWLEQAWEMRNFRMLFLAVDPAFDALRQKESFQRLVSRLHM